MPTLQDAIDRDRSNLTPVENQPVENKPPADQRVQSLLKSPYARCPLPPSNNSADSLRQWGQGSEVPKFRTQTPPSNTTGSGGTTNVSEFVSGGGGTPSPTPAPVPTLPKVQSASVTTPALSPNQKWTGTVQMAKGFLMLAVSTNVKSRVELYGTKAGQTLDLARPITSPPPNTTVSIIMDVVLQSALSWAVLDCVGANGNSPQTSTIYITVTNLSNTVKAVQASMQFVPSQS